MVPMGDAHWRDSARSVRFFFFDAKAVFPFVLFLLHIRWWTFILALVTAITFTILNHFGFSVPVFLRFMRSFMAGKRKVAKPWWIY
jgi:intracellular multiplication protein IcmT